MIHTSVLDHALTETLDHTVGLVDMARVFPTVWDLDGHPLVYTATVHSPLLADLVSAQSDDKVFALAIAVDLVREAVAAPVKAGAA